MKYLSGRAVSSILSASNFHAFVSNALFRRTSAFAWARSTEIMSTLSEVDFKWSIKLIGYSQFYVGIASTAEQKTASIYEYDENAIVFSSQVSKILVGTSVIHTGLRSQNNGDVIHFTFLSQARKLLIDWVRAL